jgi:predicted ArsR family transcriptional regulator
MDASADIAAAHPSGPRDRADVLALVQASATGVTAAEVAAKAGLRPSTARSHLDILVDAGLLVKARASAGLPYRPAWRYRCVTADPAPTIYRLLLGAVLDDLAAGGDDDRGDAATIGQEWGRALAAEHDGDTGERLLAVLDALGFSPGAVPPEATEVHLYTCPYLQLVRRHPDAMCRLHAGLLDGVLQQAGGRGGTVVLEPFAAADACVVRLRRPRQAPKAR